MASHRTERRKKLVVNKPMQGKLITNMALMPAIALAGIAVFTGFYVKGVISEALATDDQLPDLMPLFYLVIVFELLAAVFLMVNSLKISHKVAGPAYRICKCLEQIRGGDIAFKVKLRDGDHLTEIRDEMNLLLDYLNENPAPGMHTRAMAAREAAEEAEAAKTQPAQDPSPTAETAKAQPEAGEQQLLPIDNAAPQQQEVTTTGADTTEEQPRS